MINILILKILKKFIINDFKNVYVFVANKTINENFENRTNSIAPIEAIIASIKKLKKNIKWLLS